MKKFKSLIALMFSIALCAFTFEAAGFNPYVGAACGAAFSVFPNVIAVFNPDAYEASAYVHMALFKELWVDNLIDRLEDDDSFLMDGEDMTVFVQYNKLNLSIAGVDPTVVINRSTYPVPVASSDDTPGEILLNNYSTDITLLHDTDLQTLAYNKISKYNEKHKRAIREKYANHGLYSIGPTEHSADTPVLEFTGPVNSSTGKKTLVSKDISRLASAADAARWSKVGRRLVLPSDIFWNFVETDTSLKNQAVINGANGNIDGAFVSYYGFKIYSRDDTPYYDDTNVKKAYGAIITGTDRRSCLAYVAKQSFVTSRGSVKMFLKQDDPEILGTAFNYLMFAFVGRKENKYVGALIEV